jgi:hypothetical protein
VTETHASPVRPLPDFAGYHWLSVCRQETRSSGGVRGSGGVACLTRDSLQNMVSLVAADEFARFMWVRVRARVTPPRDIYIAVCYFPPTSSSFAIHNDFNGDPFIDLYTGITQYSVVGEVILLGDFNTRTRDLQTPLHDRSEDMFCTRGIDPESVGLHRLSDDALGPITAYGRHLLQLGESQELLILNGLPCFPGSRFFTCRPHGGGTSVVDYVLSSQNLIPFIRHLSVSPIPLADHALLSFSLQFDPPHPNNPPSPLRAHPTPPFDSTKATLTYSPLSSAKCSHLRPNSPRLTLPQPSTPAFHPPFGKQPSSPFPIPPDPLPPQKLDLVP